jgi:PadR family transcriptional regulator PadR
MLGLASLGMRGESLKGHLDLLILAVLSRGPLHGYAVIEELRARSGDVFDLPEGTVYPALHRLEKAGLLSSTWSAGTGRRRRTYDLTREGRSALESGRSSWHDFSAAVTQVLKGAAWNPT